MAKEIKLSGTQKAAILFITLGPDASSEILKRLPEVEVQKITYEISNIVSVKATQKQNILNEFIEINRAREYMMEGGSEYARNILSKAFGAQRAKEVMDRVEDVAGQYRPFSIARKAEASQLLNVLLTEHPQTIALVLCYLQADKAGEVLALLPEEIQSEVGYRIATMSSASPILIKEIEKVIDSKLSSVVKSDSAALGGVDTLVDILNQVDRTTEKNITQGLESESQELAEIVRSSMFVFEDIVILDDISIQKVLRELDGKELALALKGCSEQVSDVIFRNQSKRAAATLKEDIEFLGPVRLADVEKAQQRVVLVIRKLDESGEIVISRGGENAIIE